MTKQSSSTQISVEAILVINCGSSSVKFSLLQPDSGKTFLSGLAECLTSPQAVQRSADLVSIGPMLQGLNKPVNDLSRGALVDDIVYTIALTAIQATE